MAKTKIILGIGALVAFLAGVIYITATQSGSENDNQEAVKKSAYQTNAKTDTKTGMQTDTGYTKVSDVNLYTMADVAKHSDPAISCWSVVDRKVYDLTYWINKHPGGKQVIKNMCGKDSTEDFLDRHGGQDKPENFLASLKVGELK